MKNKALAALAAVSVVALATALVQPGQAALAAAATAQSSPAAQAVVQRAAQALGGVEKLRAVRNITLNGYGQIAYQNGGGRIDGDPDAPEKLIAQNDLHRIYDLENDRYRATERRNNLFPFLLPNGHAFNLVTQSLDGDVGFNVNVQGQANRVARLADADGARWRRIQMLNNPVVLVRALMDPATRLSAPRTEAGLTVVDAVVRGERVKVAFSADGKPRSISWAGPLANLGEVVYTTIFTGWGEYDGVMLPHGYLTRMNWRSVEFQKLYVDAYQLNTQIPDLAAPAAVRSAPEPVSYAPAAAPTATVVAKGVWRLSNGTTVIEFKDHLVLFELGLNARQAKPVIDAAKALAPGKPIRYLIPSHNHFDHTAGVRAGMAEGATFIGRPRTLSLLKELHDQPAAEFKDALATTPVPFRSREIVDHLTLKDDTQQVEVYWGRQNGHMADVVFLYLPQSKVMVEGDMVTAAYDWQHWPDTFRDVIAYYKLDVERVDPVHSVVPNHPTQILTRAEAEALLKGGTERARENCKTMEAKGVYHPGCPIQSKYY